MLWINLLLKKYVLNYCHLYDVPTSAVRFFNVYGPNQNPNSPYSGVISIVMDSYKRLLANQEVTFNIFGDGKQSRFLSLLRTWFKH